MSVECGECEGSPWHGHAENCSRHPNNRKPVPSAPVTPARLDDPKTWEGIGETYESAPASERGKAGDSYPDDADNTDPLPAPPPPASDRVRELAKEILDGLAHYSPPRKTEQRQYDTGFVARVIESALSERSTRMEKALNAMAPMFRTFIEEVESVGGRQAGAWTVYNDAIAALGGKS